MIPAFTFIAYACGTGIVSASLALFLVLCKDPVLPAKVMIVFIVIAVWAAVGVRIVKI